MNRKDISEIKKQLNPDRCCLTRICGCYVDAEKQRKTELSQIFLSLAEEEMFKYFDILKKTLSGTVGRNLLSMEFPLEAEAEGSQHEFLRKLVKSRLTDDTLLDAFYQQVIEKFDYAENYLTKYYDNIRNTKKAWQECKHIIPLIHRLAIKQQKAINTICEVNYNANSIKTPYLIFRYTSPAGKSTRSHRIIIDEDIIVELRSDISQKLSKSGHAKEQRKAMTADLREAIKKRDNYTCQICGNSVLKEPNLLLEVDHIVPVSKGGKTEASNLQTLCWRCNRAKSDKE